MIKPHPCAGDEQKNGEDKKLTIVLLALYAMLAVGGSTCFKLGASKALNLQLTGGFFLFRISWLSLLGLCMYAASFILYMGMLSKMEMSVLVPVSVGTVYILSMLVSVVVFHEPFSVEKIIGAVLVLAGIVLMTIKSK